MAGEPSALERLRKLEEARRAEARPSAPPSGRAPRRGLIALLIGAVSFLLIKGKVVLIFALTQAKFLFAALKLGPLVMTAYTMLLAAGAYALSYGWSFAIGLVLLILVHELGHGLAAARVGLRVGAPVFVPFLGAFIALRGKPRSTADEAIVAAGGPIIGSLAAATCVGLSFLIEGADLLRVVGFYALVINLFNLTPVWQLDGARMLAPVGPGVMLAGTVAGIVVLAIAAARADHLNPVALIAVGALLVRVCTRLYRRRRAQPDASVLERVTAIEQARSAIPDDVTTGARHRAALVYFAALLILIAATHGLEQWLPSLR
jgi:Zn-dependent protease